MKRHQRQDEIRLIFYLQCIQEISLLVFKKILSCDICLWHLTQSSSCLCTCYICGRFIQHMLVINACVADRVFLWNNFPDYPIVWVKIIRVSASRWWRFPTAISAIASRPRSDCVGVQIDGLCCMMLRVAAPTLAFGNYSAQDCRLGGALMAVLCLHHIVASQVTISLYLVHYCYTCFYVQKLWNTASLTLDEREVV